MKVSIIIPCKARLKHLRQTFKGVLKQNYPNLEIIVVDYMCPHGTIDHINQNYKDERIKVVQASVGPDEWNLSAARNFGYKNSTGDILLFLDADTMVHYKFTNDCVNKLKPGFFLSGKHHELKWHSSGCCMIYRSDFEKVGGYNEVVEGWGSEDLDMYRRLEGQGLINEYFNLGYIKNIPHDDSVRNMYFGNRNIYETNSINAEKCHKEFKGIW